MNISQTNHGIFMHQKEYIEKTEVVEIDKHHCKDRKLLPHETQQLRRVAGQLNWVSTQTRPDMVYATSVVSSPIKDATARELVFIKLLKSNKIVLQFPKVNDLQNASFVSLSDASFPNLKCGGSQGGATSVSTRKKWEIYFISLTVKKAK